MNNDYRLAYPRKRLARGLTRLLGRTLLKLLCKVHIYGRENFPELGPLLVVGNHVAAMEAVMMTVLTPWQVELLGAGDIPHEKITQLVSNFFGFIPVNRGHVDRSALMKALDVLKQNGVIGLFPEGGIWEPGVLRAQTGLAWLSYHAGAPVLPIGFGDTKGALSKALRLEFPDLSMRIGEQIPAAKPQAGVPRKAYFETYAERVLEAIQDLIPAAEQSQIPRIENERFELQYKIMKADGSPVEIPEEFKLQHTTPLAKMLHRPVILKTLHFNLQLPIEALQDLSNTPSASRIAHAAESILHYLERQNEYFLIYRFGPKEGEAMQLGLEELKGLARWVDQQDLVLQLIPIRRYHFVGSHQEIIQTRQESFKEWM
jgi:1-acyl-sn-glycerol-3-phosphate acyltransferase